MMVLPFGLLFTAILTADVSAFSGLQSYARALIPAVAPPKPSNSLQFDCDPNVYSASGRFAGSNALGGLGVSGNHNANVGFKGVIGSNSYGSGYNDDRDDKYDASSGDRIGGRFSGYGRIGGGSGYGLYGTGSAGTSGALDIGAIGGVGGGGSVDGRSNHHHEHVHEDWGGNGGILHVHDGREHREHVHDDWGRNGGIIHVHDGRVHGGHALNDQGRNRVIVHGDWGRNERILQDDWGRNGVIVHGDWGRNGGLDGHGDYGAQQTPHNQPHWRHSLGDSGTMDTIRNC